MVMHNNGHQLENHYMQWSICVKYKSPEKSLFSEKRHKKRPYILPTFGYLLKKSAKTHKFYSYNSPYTMKNTDKITHI